MTSTSAISAPPSPAEARPARHLGLHHLAFFRGHLDGLDLAVLGERYLETGADRVKAKQTVRWIRDALIAAARKQRPALVKLLAIPPGRIADAPAAIPSLEDFQAHHDPEGFFSEAELIREFQKAYPVTDPAAARRARRNQRLRQRLREAVAWLEARVAQAPQPGDSVFAWFDAAVAARLSAGGLSTLDDLVRHIRRRGRHWHRNLPQVGPVTARRLEGFLVEHLAMGEGGTPGANSRGAVTAMAAGAGRSAAFATGSRFLSDTSPREVISSTFVPLERFVPPGDLSGATGANRRYGRTLAAPDDRAAIEAWLASLGPRPHTVRSYRTQSERFLLWMIFERGKPLSSATTEDCASYRDFLYALDGNSLWYWRLPREAWIGTRSTPRWHEDWRPFAGGLSPNSQKLAVTVLTAMCEWLTRQHYLLANPWDGVPPTHGGPARIRADHALTRSQWQALIKGCDALPMDEAWYRLRFTLLLAYGLGLRLSELVGATIAPPVPPPGQPHLGLKPARGQSGWDLEVLGKGQKPRSIPVPDAVMEALIDYMEVRGLGRDPGWWPAHAPLIATLGGGLQHAQEPGGPLSGSALYRLLQRHFRRTAKEMPTALEAGHLMAASTHWLRHTHATHALEAGAAIEEVQENLGHASPATTAIYSHTGRHRRKAAVEKLMAFGQGSLSVEVS